MLEFIVIITIILHYTSAPVNPFVWYNGAMKEARDFYDQFDVCREHDVPFCGEACPFRLDIIDICQRVDKKRFNAAYKTLRDAVVFPGIVAELCPARCQGFCIRKTFDDPVQIQTLERSIISLASRKDPNSYNLPKRSERVAVIGAGLSGMAFALKMASRKCDVTVFEKSGKIGGSLADLMDESEYMAEFDLQFKNEEYELKLNTEITALDELGDFDVIYVATGAGGNDFGIGGQSTEIGKTGVLLGGSLTGKGLMEALAEGAALALVADNYLKTGKIELPADSDPSKCVANEDLITPTPAVQPGDETIPADGDGRSATYSEDEAVAEAARCIRCKCDGCSAYCDLVAFYEKSPVKMRDEIFLSVKPAGSLVHKSPARKYIAACTECDIMQEGACPEHIELCNMIKVAKHQMHNVDKMPAAYKQYFVRDTEHANGPEAAIVKPAPAQGAKSSPADGAANAGAYAFFPGCSLGALNPDYVIKPYKWLLDNYPGTGLILKCCSVPLDWAGNTKPHEEALAQIKADWESLGKPTLVIACLSCEKHFRQYLPEIETVSLYELMAEADADPAGGAAPADCPATTYSIFDPCSARGNDKVQAAIRKLASACGVATEELPKGDMHGCCGFGGQGAVAQPDFAKYVTEQRAALADNPYLVYCANCYDVFAGQDKPATHILDLLFGIDGPCAAGNPAHPALPTVTQRRANRVTLKEQLLKEIWNEDMETKPAQPKYNLIMSDDVATKVEAQRILADDIISVIDRAETTGRRTRNPENGHYKAYNEIGAITLWVEYGDLGNPADKDREIYNIYSHRMQIKLEAVFNGKKVDG